MDWWIPVDFVSNSQADRDKNFARSGRGLFILVTGRKQVGAFHK